MTCDIPWTCTHLGDRSVSAAGPRLYNYLSAPLRNNSISLMLFKETFEDSLVRVGLLLLLLLLLLLQMNVI